MPSMPSAFLHRRLVIAIATTLLPMTVFAQSEHETIMPAIVVVGDGPDAVSKMTGSVVLIDREQLEMIVPQTTEDALRRVPGINAKTEDESGIVSNIGMRGLSSSETKTLILEDGVPVAPGLFVGNGRYFNPRIQRMEGIEVLKGSASLRYGPSTIGGVINYITKTPDDGVKISAKVGSFNARQATVEAGGRSESGDAFAGIVVTHDESDGFMDKGYDMDDVMAKAGVRISDTQKLGMKFSYYKNAANISYRGLLLDDFNANRTYYNPAPDDWFLTDRHGFDLNHEWMLSDRAILRTLAYWSEMSRDYWRYNVDTPASNAAGRWVYTDDLTGNNRSFERKGVETRLNLDHNLFGFDNDAEFGLRYMTEKSDDLRIRATRAADRTGVIDRHRADSADSIAGYAQNRFSISERLAITPGLRIEHYKQKRVVLSDNNASASTTNTEFLPGVGATYKLTDSAQLYGGVYEAFSPASNGVALDGLTDQHLDGERSENYEMGIRGTEGDLNYEVAAFYMDFDNQVVTGNSNPLLSQSNAGKTEHYGMEFVLGYILGGGFSIDSNATWVPKSEFKTGENKGNRLPYAPKYLGNISFIYSNDKLSAALLAHHRGAQFGDASNTVDIPTDAAEGIWGGRLPSYTLVDLTGQYKLSKSLTFFGALKNLTDKHYITGLRQGIYVGPNRSVEAGIRYNL